MSKLRVYVETSVWSFAFAEDVPDYRADTLAFFERCRQGQFDVYASGVVLEEVARADVPLRKCLMNLIRECNPTLIDLTPTADQLASAFVAHRIVPPNKPDDARHVAIAFAEEIDVLVSWNFRHIANVRRAERFNAVALTLGYRRPLQITSPSEVFGEDENDMD